MKTPVDEETGHLRPSPVALMHLVSGMKIAKIIAVANELGLFGSLSGGRVLSEAELARRHGLQARPAGMLLTACTALGLLRRTGEGYRNSPLAEEYLVRGNPYYIGDHIAMLDRRSPAGWGRLGDAVRENRPTGWDSTSRSSPFDESDGPMVETFWQAMHSLSRYTARLLSAAVDFSGDRRVLDIGGGGGAFAIELCGRYDNLRATIYDLPFVCEMTAKVVEKSGMADRIGFASGDFFRDDALPTGHDTCLLSMILHDWGPAENLEILTKAHRSLPPGGRVLISEFFLDDDGSGPLEAALMNLAMLVETRDGRNYPREQYVAWLREVGFADITFHRFEGLSANGVIAATRS